VLRICRSAQLERSGFLARRGLRWRTSRTNHTRSRVSDGDRLGWSRLGYLLCQGREKEDIKRSLTRYVSRRVDHRPTPLRIRQTPVEIALD
jgi:hypothetical protein